QADSVARRGDVAGADCAGGAADRDRGSVAVDGSGGAVRFAGYAAVFDRPDKGGDIIRKGAFANALNRAREVPLLWQHKAGAVIGRIEHLSEDARGLRVIAAVGDARASRLLG